MIPYKLQHIAQHLCIPSQVLSDMQCTVPHTHAPCIYPYCILESFLDFTQGARDATRPTTCTGAAAEGFLRG